MRQNDMIGVIYFENDMELHFLKEGLMFNNMIK